MNEVDSPVTLRSEISATLQLAAPVALASLSQVTMNLVDTAFVGPMGAQALGSVALGTSLYFAPSILLMGTVSAVGPIVAQRHGAKDAAGILQIHHDGWWVALVAGALGTLGLLALAAHNTAVGVEPELSAWTGSYLAARSLGLIPALLFIVHKCLLEGQGIPTPGLYVMLTANLVNVVGNWLFVYGHLGMPRLGVTGSGLSTSVSNLYSFLCLAAYLRAAQRKSGARPASPSGRDLGLLLRVGLPMGLHQTLEVGVFAAAAVLVNRFGAAAMAAHQVAIQLATCSFMVATGVAVAASTRVGNALGRGRTADAERAGWLAIGVGLSFMSVSAVVFLTQAQRLLHLFTDEPDVVRIGVSLLHIAGAFQLSDGLQAVTSGALRGAGDTRFSLVASTTGYWVIGLPLCLLLGFTLGYGPEGLWWGLTAGLTATALGLVGRFATGGWKSLRRL